MFIIRTVFYLIIAYFISKLVRVFFDPKVAPVKTSPNVKTPKAEPIQKKEPASTLGEYVEYEEVKY